MRTCADQALTRQGRNRGLLAPTSARGADPLVLDSSHIDPMIGQGDKVPDSCVFARGDRMMPDMWLTGQLLDMACD